MRKKTTKNKFHQTISATLAAVMAITLFPFETVDNVYAENETNIEDMLIKATYNGHTYAVINKTLSWSDSKLLCESLGGHLVSIENEAEQFYLNQLSQKCGSYKAYWIGGCKNSTLNEWEWDTGEPFVYTNWDDGEPNFEQEDKVFMYGDDSIATLGTWNNHVNSKTGTPYGSFVEIAAICEWENAEEYNIQATFDGKKYQLYDQHMTWSEAKDYCEQIGGHLITISSAEEEKFFEALIRIGKNVMYWMGGKYDFELSKWNWITGESFTYSNWDYGEPNNYIRELDGAREGYAMIYKKPNYGVRYSQAYKWNDTYIDGWLPGQDDFFFTDNFGFVCEFENKPNAPTEIKLQYTDYGIYVDWQSIDEGVCGYIVYRKKDNSTFESVSDIIYETHFEDVFECNDGAYEYAVVTVSPFGAQSEMSSAAEICVNHKAAPSNLVINLFNEQIEIKWDAPEDNNTAYFKIYRKNDSDDTYSLIKDHYKYLNYYDTDIELGANYIYCVSAVDNNGNESILTSEVNGGILCDDVAPEIVSIYPKTGSILDSKQLIGISAKDNFRLEDIIVECRLSEGVWQTVYSEAGIGSYSKSVQFELDTSNFVTGNYELRAYAHDTTGNASQFMMGNYTFKECTLSVPIVTAIGEGWRNTLSWTMENTDDLLGYRIYRKTSESEKYSLIASIKNSEYIDSNVTPNQIYYYMIEAVDSRNNNIQSNEITSVPTDTDDIQPLADAGADVMGICNEEISFNGINSWDNHYIALYEWDFGDGTTGTGSSIAHSYKNDGTYNVTLTVKDSAGNSDSHTIKAYIYSDDYGYVQFKLTDASNKTLSGVKIYCEIPGVDSTDFVTDTSGNFKFIAPKGSYDVYFYKNGYLPEYKQITVTGENTSTMVELEQKELIDGELTVRTLDINEITALGIDVTDPENQFVYEYELDYGKNGTLTFTLNAMGDIIGEVNGTIQTERNDIFTVVQTLKGENNRPVRTEYGGYVNGNGSGIPVSVAVFNVATEISWLKEFYDVELTIINNADDDFYIQNSKAVLSLPNGLSLAGTSRGEDIVQVLGTNGVIGGKETKSASWIIRGDKPGSYDLSAEFTGTLMPLNENVKTVFKTKSPIIVHDGTDLCLDITITEGLKYWTNKFTFTNNSGRPIYNFAASFSGSAQLSNFSSMYIEYPDGTVEIIDINEGVLDLENEDIFLPALSNTEESIYDHRTVEDGQSVTGFFSIYRRDGFTNDD